MELAIGLRGDAAVDVTPATTAEALGSGLVPVFATPSLVALMEQAAVAAIHGCLHEDETTVGVAIEVNHVAATPVGDRVSAEATLTAMDGRWLTFEITARDSQEAVGRARHTRAIVSRERFLSKLQDKSRR